MDIRLLTTFIGLNIANVIIQTVKSIATVKCGKGDCGSSQRSSLRTLHNRNSLHAV